LNGQSDCSIPKQTVVQIRRMWAGGPLRQWSEKREETSWLRHLGGWIGMYVCEDCMDPAPMGVYSVRLGRNSAKLESVLWLCGTCREARRERGEQPAGLRAYIARKRQETLEGMGLNRPRIQNLAMRRAAHSTPIPSSASSRPESKKPIQRAGRGRQSRRTGGKSSRRSLSATMSPLCNLWQILHLRTQYLRSMAKEIIRPDELPR
jgi:hypothetical protein